jgi:hypothetical protein
MNSIYIDADAIVLECALHFYFMVTECMYGLCCNDITVYIKRLIGVRQFDSIPTTAMLEVSITISGSVSTTRMKCEFPVHCTNVVN